MNINNIIKLLKVYFYENWQNDVIFNFAVILAITMFSTLMSPYDAGVVSFAVLILVVYYPCRLFSKLQNPSSRMHYLMVPATNEEKVVTGMILANIYYVLGIVLSVVIGLLLGFGLAKIFNPDLMFTSDLFKSAFPSSWMSVLLLYTSIAATFFAAIYFRKSPFWKLLLTGFVISTVLGIVMSVTVWLNAKAVLPAGSFTRNFIKTESYIYTGNDWFPYVFCCIMIVYFYAMSFLRMRETEA